MLRLEDIRLPMDRDDLNADLALAPGARVAVLGPSGAGKSTLLDGIAGFRAPVSGRMTWEGRDLTRTPPEARPVSILFQDGNLFPHLDLMCNLTLALRPDGRRPGAEERERVTGALARVGLEGMADRLPGTLSGGQQSRAALARVLLMARPVLLLDEPFAALGPGMKREMLALVQEVAEALGALTLMVTHDPEDARAFAREVVLVAEGRAHPPVKTAAFFDDPPEAFRAYLGHQPSPKAVPMRAAGRGIAARQTQEYGTDRRRAAECHAWPTEPQWQGPAGTTGRLGTEDMGRPRGREGQADSATWIETDTVCRSAWA